MCRFDVREPILLCRCLVLAHYAVENRGTMKLSSLAVENLGSLQKVVLDALSNLCIFVGKNGSGKSYIFNALQLFFSEFNVVGGASNVSADDYIWYRRETSRNITINAVFELTGPEFKEFGRLAGLDQDDISADVKANRFSLEAMRELQFLTGWKTSLLKLGSHPLVENDQPAQNSTSSHEPPDLSGWHLYLFDPGASADKITGSRLLTDSSTKIAYFSDPDFDALVASHGLAISRENPLQNYEEWASNNGYKLVTRPPNQSEAKELFDAISSAKANKQIRIIKPEFAERIRTSFRMVPAARDSRESQHLRPPLLDQAQANALRDISQSRKVTDEAQWLNLGSDTERVLAKRLESNPDQLLMQDKGMRLPLPQLGAGEQALLALESYLLGPASIYAIEDPENHLHPDLARRVFQLLRQKAAQLQVFVSTHSPFFVDKQDVLSNWMVRIENQQTVADRCKDDLGLRNILIELGVLPSDILYRDLVVFVEGGTEKEAVLPIWADTLGVELANDRVGIVSIGGDTRLKDNLRIWLEVAKNAPTDFLVILDSHSGHLPQQLNAEMGIDLERFIVLSEYAIEDYYPPRYIVEALRALYGIEVDADKFHKKQGVSRADTVRSILEKEGKIEKRWKVTLGAFVASRMQPNDIDSNIKNAIEKISSALK